MNLSRVTCRFDELRQKRVKSLVRKMSLGDGFAVWLGMDDIPKVIFPRGVWRVLRKLSHWRGQQIARYLSHGTPFNVDGRGWRSESFTAKWRRA